MSYDAIYAATRQSLGNPDIAGAVTSVAREAFDVSWQKGRLNEAITAIEHDIRRPSVLMRPRMFTDGNQWCCLYGESLMEGVAGFGDSPDAACCAFDKAWITPLAERAKVHIPKNITDDEGGTS